jgi:hypothetical protein
LDVVLSEDGRQNNIVAQYRLPFSFDVVAKLQGQKRVRGQMDQPEETPLVEHRPRFGDHPQRDADDEPIDGPMPAVSPRNAPPGAVPLAQPPRNAGPNAAPLGNWEPPNPPIPPPKTDGESTPTLIEVNPESGSITGGARIWLRGTNFPAVFPLFARFGTAVVPAVSLKDLRCEPQLTEF